jgi:hypothetical protein
MAELFSLILESTSCKSDRVEANRTQYRFALGRVPSGQSSTLIRRCAPPSPGGRRIRRCRNAFFLREKVPEGRMRVLLCQRRLSFKSWNYLKDGSLRQMPENRGTKKTFKANPFGKIGSIFKEFIF